MSGLPERIRAARVRRGLTLDQAARQIGIDRQTLWRWEHPEATTGSAPRGLQLRELLRWLKWD